MTPQEGNRTLVNLLSGAGRDNYLIINIILAGVVLMIMAYSGIFSPEKNNYPVVCYHQKITGVPCASCGMSHSFSLIIRGKIDEALDWNKYSLRVFLFFAVQFLLRIFLSVVYLAASRLRRNIITADILLSSMFFFYSFFPFIRQTWLILNH